MCLTNAQVQQIQQEIQAAFASPGPPDPVKWLENYARGFATGAVAGCGASPPTPGQVLVVASQACESAREAMLDLTAFVIRDAVRWIGSRVLHHQGPALDTWAEQEVGALAPILWNALVLGNCSCWVRWEDFRIADLPTAQQACAARHNLACWDGHVDLQHFLFQTVVAGCLCLPNRGQRVTEQARVNGFRHGVLAKVVGDEQVRAGPVLRCTQPGCRREIPLTDVCANCGPLPRGGETAWWLWLTGQRRPACCRRCLPNQGGCNGLYFRGGPDPREGQTRSPCPNPDCGRLVWSRSPTEVWVSSRQVPLEGLPDDSSPAPPDEAADWETIERRRAFLSSRHGRPHWDVLRWLLLDGKTFGEVAAHLGMEAGRLGFRKLVRDALEQVPPELRPEPEEFVSVGAEEGKHDHP